MSHLKYTYKLSEIYIYIDMASMTYIYESHREYLIWRRVASRALLPETI